MQLNLERVRVVHVDCAHGRKQRCAGAAETCRGPDDAGVGRLDIVGGQISTVVEFHPLAQEEGIGLAIGRNLPTVREVWDNGLAAVYRITPDEVVIHAALHAHV